MSTTAANLWAVSTLQEMAATRSRGKGQNGSCWPNKSQCRWHWWLQWIEREIAAEGEGVGEWERDRQQAGGSPLSFRLTLPAFERRNFTHTHTYRWHLLIQAQKVCHEIWHNTAAAAAAEGLSGVTWLPVFSTQLCSAQPSSTLAAGASYLTEIGISRRIFYASNENVMPRREKLRKWRKVCSIFFNQISVNVTYTQRCPTACLRAACLLLYLLIMPVRAALSASRKHTISIKRWSTSGSQKDTKQSTSARASTIHLEKTMNGYAREVILVEM